MIISLNWLKKFTEIDMPVEELATLVGTRLVEIEEAIDYGAKYKDSLVVKVVEASRIEASDHLNVTKIDDGGVVKNVERDDKGLVQVVCGASNIKAGQLVVWLPPESIVPETYGQPEPFVLGARKLCGLTSNGMIASARELGLFDEHEGILVLDTEVAPGALFADAYELNDYLLDIENKSLTHRPDCFGIVGFAREVAAIQGKTFKTPNWLMNFTDNADDNQYNDAALNITIDDSELSARYQAVVLSGADGKRQSPLQVQTYLARIGMRPINAVVDVTNYLMMLTGQPLHAFDYDKVVAVSGGKADIHVRAGHDKEKLELLDGRVIELSKDDIVIAAGETAIGLAGAMGGANTAIDENTEKIIIESATFNLYKLRSTQMRHGIFSEAITRFTKGQPAELTAPVLLAAIHLISEWSGAKRVSAIAEAYPGKHNQISLDVTTDKINDVLGTAFTDDQIISTLQNVEFGVEKSKSGSLKIAVPYWRADIHIVEDVAEEVGRLNGYDSIELMLPKRDFTAVKAGKFDDFRNKVREVLTRAGSNEVLSYSFVHGNVLQKAGQSLENSYRIVNSISPELQYYRQTLTPSLLGLVHPNIKQGYDGFALFELNKTHQKKAGLAEGGVPNEANMASLVIANKNNQDGAPYYHAKKLLDYLCREFGLEVSYEKVDGPDDDALTAPFEYRRSARVINKTTGLFIGVVGEYRKSVVRDFKLPEYAAGFELDMQAMFESVQGLTNGYTPLNRYPASERDICFRVNTDIEYGQIIDALEDTLKTVDIVANITPVDIYQPEDTQVKNITVRIRLSSYDHTLKGDEVSTIIDQLIAAVVAKTGAIVI